MAKMSFYYLLYLEGVLIKLGQTKPIDYSYLPQPTCTTTIVSIPATQKPPIATVYDSIVTVTSSVKCSGCALTTAPVVNELVVRFFFKFYEEGHKLTPTRPNVTPLTPLLPPRLPLC